MTSSGSGKIWILVPDWSRLKSSEPKAGDVTHMVGALYFTENWVGMVFTAEIWAQICKRGRVRVSVYSALPNKQLCTFILFPSCTPLFGCIQRVPASHAILGLGKKMLHEICVSWTVGSPLLMQKSPTCRDCSVGFEIGNQGLGQISVSVLESI